MSTFRNAGFTANNTFATTILSIVIGLVGPGGASAQDSAADLGMVLGQFGFAQTFDLQDDTVVGTLPAQFFWPGDCSMADDQSSAWLTKRDGNVYELDLTGPNPVAYASVAIANTGEDTVLTPDRAFLLVVGGPIPEPLSVVDLTAGAEADSLVVNVGDGTHTSVDVCADGTVLTTSVSGTVFSAAIDSQGGIALPATSLANAGDQNVYCAPGSQTGIALDRANRALKSFGIPALALVEAVFTADDPMAAVLTADGTRIFVRTLSGVEAYEYDPGTGEIGSLLWQKVALPFNNTFYGMDQIMLHPDESKLYVSGGLNPTGVKVLDPDDGVELGSVAGLIFSPTGLCRANASVDADGDGILDSADLCPDTVGDEATRKHGNNRWIWDGEDWITESNQDPDPDTAFSMEQTLGCSCNQVLDALSARTGLDFDGHYKMGCSSGLVEDWIEGYYHLETVVVPAADEDGVVSNTTLRSGEDYQLVAHGAADAAALDLQVDGASVDWGPANPDHIYLHDLAGGGAPVLLQVGNLDPSGASGEITVEIFLDLR